MHWYQFAHTNECSKCKHRVARYTSVLLIIIYRARWRGAKCCYRMVAAIFSSQKPPHQAANTISLYIQEIRCALSVAVPSTPCLLSSYRKIMSSSFCTATTTQSRVHYYMRTKGLNPFRVVLLCLRGFAESFRVGSNRANFKAFPPVVFPSRKVCLQRKDGDVSVLICCAPDCVRVKLFMLTCRRTQA